jgi:hypothetical protein
MNQDQAFTQQSLHPLQQFDKESVSSREEEPPQPAYKLHTHNIKIHKHVKNSGCIKLLPFK